MAVCTAEFGICMHKHTDRKISPLKFYHLLELMYSTTEHLPIKNGLSENCHGYLASTDLGDYFLELIGMTTLCLFSFQICYIRVFLANAKLPVKLNVLQYLQLFSDTRFVALNSHLAFSKEHTSKHRTTFSKEHSTLNVNLTCYALCDV